jgi:1,4-alpha-glucan branching enzyme
MPQLCVWAPNAQSVELVDANKQSFVPPFLLTKGTMQYGNKTLPGYWRATAGQENPLRDGDGYWLKITPLPEHGGVRFKPDPYARAMVHDQSCSIYKDEHSFTWTDDGFQPPTFESTVIYQLFQGAYVGRGDDKWIDANGENCGFIWDTTRKGDFKQLIKKLDYIQELGVNAIELLPVNEYCGDDYIGYSSASFFAIEASYGYPRQAGNSYDDLKDFVNEAHKRSIAVIADVVFNHVGTVGDSGFLWHYDSDRQNIYFSGDKAWNQSGGDFGMAPDWARWDVQKYVEDACFYYLEELHFDGLRFDFTSQIVNKNTGSGIDSGKEVLRRILWNLKQKFPKKILICEHWGADNGGNYDPAMLTYVNFDAGWFNYHKRMQDALWPYATGVEDKLADAINGGCYPWAHGRVIYANSHDECWWDGNKQEKFYPVSEFKGCRVDYWSKRKARMMYALSFLVPGTPMIFAGDEFAMDGCYNDSLFNHILNWGIEPVEPGPSFKRMFKRLIEIKKTQNPLCKPGGTFEWLQYPASGWFAFKRKRGADVLIVAGNYSATDMHDYWVNTHGETGNWEQIFNSDGQEFGGDGVGNYRNRPNSNCGTMVINIPRNGIVVMSRTSL